jgi:hypothetical protein
MKKFLALSLTLILTIVSISSFGLVAAANPNDINDDLVDFSKIYQTSGAGTLALHTLDAALPDGDSSALLKLNNTAQRYVTYRVYGSVNVTVEYVNYGGDINYAKNKMYVYQSSDNVTFSEVSCSSNWISSKNGWHRMNIVSNTTPSNTQYIKVVYDISYPESWTPMMTSVIIQHDTTVPASDNISDDLTGFDKIFTHSGLNTLTTFNNPASMPSGDTTGLVMINTSAERFITYSTNGNASVTAEYLYYSGDENYAKDRISISYSADNAAFIPASTTTSYFNSYQNLTSNWKRMSISTDILPGNAKFIKLSFDTTGNAWEPILVNVSIIKSQFSTESPGNTMNLNERVGITHVAGLYNFTTKDYLNEGVDKVIETGSKTVKLWLTPQYASVYSFNSSWGTITSMTDLAKTSYYKDAFAKPLKHYILEAYEFTNYNWKTGLSTAQKNSINEEFYNLTKYLLETYDGTGKTFVLQNWEGDNALRLDLMTTSQEKTTAINGMIDWLNARQDGINRAKSEVSSTNVKVYGAIEVNKVSSALSGEQKIIDVVVPYTYADLYSYSNWETGTNAGLLWDNLNYVAEKAPSSNDFGDKNIFIGEFGAAESSLGSDANQLNQVRIQLETALAWGVQYAIYWELYCNEAVTSYTGRPVNSDLRGFWLIRPDGTFTLTYDYIKSVCSQTFLYDNMEDWSKSFSHTSNLAFDGSNLSYFENDASRIVRTADTPGDIVYYSGGISTQISDFNVMIYYYAAISGRFKAYTSADGTNWAQIVSLTSNYEKIVSGEWKRVSFSPTSALPSGTRFVKYSIQNDANVWTPQISRSIIYTSAIDSFTDNLDNWNNVFSRSPNLALDSGNSSYMENDTSRVLRTSNTEEYIVYKTKNIIDFSARIYFTGIITNKVKGFCSSDSLTWTEIPMSSDTPVQTLGDWFKADFKPASYVPQGTNFIKITLRSDANIWSPQIGRVTVVYNKNTQDNEPVIFNTYNLSGENVVSGFPKNLTYSSFLNNMIIAPGVSVQSFNRYGIELTGASLVGTGATVTVDEGTAIINYLLLLKGDIDGDGNILIGDLASVKQQLLKSVALSGVFFSAADINSNGSVTVSDLLSLKKQLIGI